jgi:membrane protease YdiL (CAAX protease family)
LALVPLAGLVSVVMPLAEIIVAAWPLLVVMPLLLALGLTARQLNLGREALGLTLKYGAQQACIMLLGVPLGLLAYVGLRPAALSGGAIALAVGSLSVLAFVEELLFRGLLQPFMCRLYGEAGIAVTATLSAAVAMGARSLPYALFAWLVAGGFGLASRRTGSIAGTSAARALLFIGLLVVWPLVLG